MSRLTKETSARVMQLVSHCWGVEILMMRMVEYVVTFGKALAEGPNLTQLGTRSGQVHRTVQCHRLRQSRELALVLVESKHHSRHQHQPLKLHQNRQQHRRTNEHMEAAQTLPRQSFPLLSRETR